MKLIIEIPEKTIAHIRSDYGHGYRIIQEEDRDKIADAIYYGTPLGDVKAEIERIYQDTDTVSHSEYENAVEQGKETAYENVLEIIDNIGKSKGIENERKREEESFKKAD